MHSHLLLMAVHMLSGVAFMAGVVLLIVWAAKNLKKDKLKKYGTVLIVVGVVVGALTCPKFGPLANKGMHHIEVLEEVLEERGVTFTDKEWEEIHEEIKAEKKAMWKGDRDDDDEDDEDEEE